MEALLKDEELFEYHQEEYNEENENAPPGKKMRSGSVFKAIGFNRPRAMSGASGRSTDHGAEADGDEDDSDEDVDETAQLRKKSPDGQRRRRRTTDEDMAASHVSSRRKTSVAFEDYNDMAFSALYDEGVSLKKRAVSVYVLLCELRSFIQLNKTGFEKVLKKYDKIMDRKLKKTYLNKYVYPAYPFQQSTMDTLTRNLERMEEAYAQIGTKGDIVEAKRELRLHLREHVVWERNTVWREMIGIERKAQAANIGISHTLLGRDTTGGKIRRQGDEVESDMKEVDTPIGRYRCPQWLVSRTFWILLACIAVFVVLLVVPIMEAPEQQNCLAMVIFVSLLWATEVCRAFENSSSMLTTTGHTSLRYIAPGTFSRSNTECSPKRRGASPETGIQGSGVLRLFRHVDASHHAATGWFHNRRRAIKVQHRQDDGYLCPQQGRNEAKDRPCGQHVRRHVRQYVDQQRCRTRAMLLHHPGTSPPSKPSLPS